MGGFAERRSIEWWRVAIELVVIIFTNAVLLIGAYYKLDNRVTITETRQTASEARIDQETKGYAVLQQEFVRRLERMEDKLDKAIEEKNRPLFNFGKRHE